LGNFFRTIPALCFLRVGPRLLESRLQFLVVEGKQNVAGFNAIAFANEHFVDTAAYFRPYTNVARFDGTGANQRVVPVEPTCVHGRGGHHNSYRENDEKAFPVHELIPCLGNDPGCEVVTPWRDRKSTRLNSSHRTISYAVFCL